MLEKLFYYSRLFLQSPAPKFKRSIYTNINFDEKLIGLRGAKGVGKTTIIKQYLQQLPYSKKEILYVSVDNSIVAEKILTIAEEAHKKGVKVIAFDEIHYQEDFENDLKTIYDFFDMQVLFSGPSAIALSNPDLSRRAVMYDVPILSFREYLELTTSYTFRIVALETLLQDHYDIAYAITQKIKPLKYFEEYLHYGAYPFFLESDPETYSMKLLEAINKTIESDLLYLFHIDTSKIIILKKLLLLLCQNPPGSFNLTNLSREIGINIKTLYNYIEALRRGKLIHLLYYHKKGNALFQKPDKILLENPNLFTILCDNQNRGAVRESFFVSQLYKHSIRYTKQGDYVVDERYTFEIGGKRKNKKQIKNIPNAYVVRDDIETALDAIPLWIFGFLY